MVVLNCARCKKRTPHKEKQTERVVNGERVLDTIYTCKICGDYEESRLYLDRL